MKSARDVLRAVLGVAWNVGLVVIVLAMIAAMSTRNWNSSVDDSVDDAPENAPPSVVSASEGDKTRMKLDVGAGKAFSNYILEDGEGKELLLLTYSRTGSLIVTLGDSFPVRPGYSATVDGLYDFEVAHGGYDYRLKIRPGGTSGFTVCGPPYGRRKGVGVTAAGEFIEDPPVVD